MNSILFAFAIAKDSSVLPESMITICFAKYFPIASMHPCKSLASFLIGIAMVKSKVALFIKQK
jgi:hypothetical protein